MLHGKSADNLKKEVTQILIGTRMKTPLAETLGKQEQIGQGSHLALAVYSFEIPMTPVETACTVGYLDVV